MLHHRLNKEDNGTNMKKKEKKSLGNRQITGRIVSIAAALFLLVFVWRSIFSDFEKIQPITGFDLYLEKEDICTIAFLGDEVWAGGVDGLFVLRKSNQTSSTLAGADISYETEEIGDFSQVKAVLAAEDGIWAGHEEGLSFISGDKILDWGTEDGLPDKRVNALEYDSQGILWVGTWGGVAFLDDREIIGSLRAKDGLIDDMINAIFKAVNGDMWLGSYVAPRGGISIVNQFEIQNISLENGLLHSNINAIIELKDKMVLTGGGLFTKGGGTVFQYKGNKWSKVGELTKKDGIAGEKIRALFLDSTDRIWVGSEYDGVAIIEDFSINTSGKIEYSDILTITQDNGLPNNEVKVIAESKDGNIWVGTRAGLLKIEKGGIENVRNPG